MSLSFTDARDEILTLFKTAWDASAFTAAPVLYWDVASDDDLPDPRTTELWSRITVRHEAGRNDSIGNSIFQREGTVTIQIFTRIGEGLANADLASKVAVDAYQGQSTPGGCWFRNVRMNEIGSDGAWFQVNILADFEYVEEV